jgi:hypothetical protein
VFCIWLLIIEGLCACVFVIFFLGFFVIIYSAKFFYLVRVFEVSDCVPHQFLEGFECILIILL